LIWTIEVSQEKADKDMVWRAGDELYYPKWYDDPDFSVLKFMTKKIKCYSNFNVQEISL
jgi:general stress protein 26